ncbi:37071_t:CDS:2, partial [Gigaspora margarita]
LRSSTRKPLRNLETPNENIQEFVANKVAMSSNSVELDKRKNKQEETEKNNKETSQVDYSLIDMLSDMQEQTENLRVCEETENLIEESEMDDLSCITGSNYKLVWASLNTSRILSYGKLC